MIIGTTRAIFCELRMVNVIVPEVGYIIDDEELTEGNSGIEMCLLFLSFAVKYKLN